ncbi:MAG: flagellar biosynthesis protein FlhA [Gammaproteobacteria bacterium]|nr:flagellar biosynthesis protein FlhA [Gammaproteobacteria bacterium]
MSGAAKLSRLQLVGLGTPVLLLALLAMVVIPLPPLLLDVLFTFNIALSLIVILMAVYTQRPLDFSIFPTVLLVATLLRLALNIASTRVVLLNGHTGTDAAGRVIEAFGEFVIGGNYAVGLVVFAILVIINFVVVTKGAGRVSEVSARFTLDSIPGKQMAIDADLNAGILTHEEARQRREDIAREADFYGSMDGASKFVRGDAIAGILILFINIAGGLVIGTATHGMALGDAAANYVLLTIGDGLVAQLPGLVLSSATAVIVTRVSSAEDMGQQVMRQVFDNPRALLTVAGIIAALGLVPGMPLGVFLLLAAPIGALGWYRRRTLAAPESGDGPAAADAQVPAEERELSWDDVAPVDLLGLELGYRLIPLVDRSLNRNGEGASLMARIKGVRRKLSQELGFLLHPVHIRDNLELAPTAYRFSLHGVPVADGEVAPDCELAINPGRVYGSVQGQATREPAFGLEAVWIDPARREEAQALGYTVVDVATVIATHLSRVLKSHAHELLGHEEVQQLLDVLGRSHPKLVESLVPKSLQLNVVLRVLQNLLVEEVPVRDMRTIAETLVQHAGRGEDPDALTAAVRVALGRGIVQSIAGNTEELPLMALDPALEQLLQKSTGGGAGGPIEPGLAERLQQSVRDAVSRCETDGDPAILVVSPGIRAWLARWLRPGIPGLHVLAFTEIPESRAVRVVATLGRDDSQRRILTAPPPAAGAAEAAAHATA